MLYVGSAIIIIVLMCITCFMLKHDKDKQIERISAISDAIIKINRHDYGIITTWKCSLCGRSIFYHTDDFMDETRKQYYCYNLNCTKHYKRLKLVAKGDM